MSHRLIRVKANTQGNSVWLSIESQIRLCRLVFTRPAQSDQRIKEVKGNAVAQRLIRNRGDAGSSMTGGTALCP